MGVSPSSPANIVAVADSPGKDIYPGNILFRVPELDSLLPENITKEFGEPIIGKLAWRDGKPSAEGIPNYSH